MQMESNAPSVASILRRHKAIQTGIAFAVGKNGFGQEMHFTIEEQEGAKDERLEKQTRRLHRKLRDFFRGSNSTHVELLPQPRGAMVPKVVLRAKTAEGVKFLKVLQRQIQIPQAKRGLAKV